MEDSSNPFRPLFLPKVLFYRHGLLTLSSQASQPQSPLVYYFVQNLAYVSNEPKPFNANPKSSAILFVSFQVDRRSEWTEVQDGRKLQGWKGGGADLKDTPTPVKPC